MCQSFRRATVDLDLFRDLFSLRICLCGYCEKLRTELKSIAHAGPRWSYICSYLEESGTCGFLAKVHSALKGSFCHWKVCFGCFLEDRINLKPVTEPISKIIDINTFSVHHEDNKEGECPKHGRYFMPYCVGEPPELICLISETEVASNELVMCPLELTWSGSELLSETRSGFCFIPNFRRWPHTITYRVMYDVSLYPEDRKSRRYRQYDYILSRVTKPKAPYPSLDDLLEGMSPDRNIWLLQNEIMGSCNNGKSTTGEFLFNRVFQYPREIRKNDKPSIFSREHETKRQKAPQETRKPAKRPKFISNSETILNVHSEENSLRSSQKTPSVSPSVECNGSNGKRNDREALFVDQKTSPFLKGDPLYDPSDDSDISSFDKNGSGDEYVLLTPSKKRNFLFEEEVRLAQKRGNGSSKVHRELRSKSSPPDKLEKESSFEMQNVKIVNRKVTMKSEKYSLKNEANLMVKADHEEDKHKWFTKNSFRTSYKQILGMEYRSPILRAPSSYFPYSIYIEV